MITPVFGYLSQVLRNFVFVSVKYSSGMWDISWTSPWWNCSNPSFIAIWKVLVYKAPTIANKLPGNSKSYTVLLSYNGHQGENWIRSLKKDMHGTLPENIKLEYVLFVLNVAPNLITLKIRLRNPNKTTLSVILHGPNQGL